MILRDKSEFYECELETRMATGVRFRGESLTNSLQDAEWPSRDHDGCGQVHICEACGWPRCKIGGYVEVWRTDRYLLWTRHLDPKSQGAEEGTVEAVEKLGPILMPWNIWREWCVSIPTLDTNCPFRPITWGAIVHGSAISCSVDG